jgi:hypothetical protein
MKDLLQPRRNKEFQAIGVRRHIENYGPIMVQQFFLNALKLLLGATRVV